jgi:16S rRNA (uracil1498-N3)-methyltransferase
VNLFLLTETCRLEVGESPTLFRLPDAQARHALSVLRVSVGSLLRVGLLNGPVGVGTVVLAAEGAVHVAVAWASAPPPQPSLELWLAVPRPKVLARILRDAPTLGVRHLVLIRTARVDKAYVASPLLTPERYRPLLHEGLMQARATQEPSVEVEPLFRPFIEDRAPRKLAGSGAFIVHPETSSSLAAASRQCRATQVVCIGPEGGFVPFEIALAQAAGLTPVHLGTRILRVETAVSAALTLLASQA